MTKNSRIKKDKVFLIDNGFSRIRNTAAYDYKKDWESAAMVYTCKKDKEKYEQVILPDDISFNHIYNTKVLDLLTEYDVLHKKQDLDDRGILYNILATKDDVTVVLYISYDIANDVVSKKEIKITGKPYG